MGVRPKKRTSFQQGVYQISDVEKERLGTLRETMDGRKYRYARAGGTALAAGKMGIARQADSDHVNETGIAADVGTRQLTLAVTAGTAIAADELKGGFLHINDAAGEGHQYEIESNTAITNAETSITITITPGLKIAMTALSEFTLVHSPWEAVTESAVEENLPVGIAPVAVTADYYYWAQTGGEAIALISGTPAVGSMLTLAAVAGALGAINASLDIDQPYIAIAWGTVGVDTEYKPVKLLLD